LVTKLWVSNQTTGRRLLDVVSIEATHDTSGHFTSLEKIPFGKNFGAI
jgi:hypothetical protein